MSRPYTAPAIRRAVDALTYLARCPAPVRLSEIAREIHCGKSTALGVLRTLEEVGWVAKDATGYGYSVGERLFDLTRKAFTLRELKEIARPYLERVADRCGESAFLGVLRGDKVVIEMCVEGAPPMCITARPGSALPLLAGATGKVFLAGMGEDAARVKVGKEPLTDFTDRSVTDPEALLGEVASARERGYATDDEEYLRGVRAVAAPLNRGQEMVGAMWVAGFATRFTDERIAVAMEELVLAARTCSGHLAV